MVRRCCMVVFFSWVVGVCVYWVKSSGFFVIVVVY